MNSNQQPINCIWVEIAVIAGWELFDNGGSRPVIERAELTDHLALSYRLPCQSIGIDGDNPI